MCTNRREDRGSRDRAAPTTRPTSACPRQSRNRGRISSVVNAPSDRQAVMQPLPQRLLDAVTRENTKIS